MWCDAGLAMDSVPYRELKRACSLSPELHFDSFQEQIARARDRLSRDMFVDRLSPGIYIDPPLLPRNLPLPPLVYLPLIYIDRPFSSLPFFRLVTHWCITTYVRLSSGSHSIHSFCCTRVQATTLSPGTATCLRATSSYTLL
jgi:hypothetical protein